MFFTFPEDARWNAETQAIEFGVGIGEYEGVVRVPRQIFRRFIDGALRQNGALKPTTCFGRGWSWSSSASCGSDS